MRTLRLSSRLFEIAGMAGMMFACGALPSAAADAKPANGKVKKPTIKDMRKGIIEFPVKKLFAQNRPLFVAPKSVKPKAGAFENPAVKPGDVRWHADFDTAVARAKRSKKPVLLFQLIGRLDQRFS